MTVFVLCVCSQLTHAADDARTLIVAHEVYGENRFAEALRRLGDFLILAQMPEPEPAGAQQYSYDMHPIWARRFEPPAVASHESQDVLETLIRIYALSYLRRPRPLDQHIRGGAARGSAEVPHGRALHQQRGLLAERRDVV